MVHGVAQSTSMASGVAVTNPGSRPCTNETTKLPRTNPKQTTIKVTCHIASSSKSNNCIKQHNTLTIIVRPRQTKSSEYNMRCRK